MDPPLSDAGRAQAERVASALQTVSLEGVYSSPLQRAIDTAAMLAATHALSVELVADLREIAFGEWESLSNEEVEQQFGPLLREWWRHPDQTQIPGAEPLAQGRERAMAALRGIVDRHPDGQVAVVAHGGMNKLVLLTLLDAPLASFWRLAQSNACINIVEFNGSRGRILAVNDTTHLR
jgi:alpha-ribazole phosphatase/probable phosphoglycerate mutase